MAPVLFSIEWKRQVEDDMASGERMQSLHDMLIQLRDPFRAVFLGGAGDSDGTFEWDSPIELTHQQGDGTELHLRYEPTSVPLEVGHVAPETVPWHIRYEGGIARWPYGSESIALLLTTRRYPGRSAGRALHPDLISGQRVADEGFPLETGLDHLDAMQ
jgi:hypothetical protein